MQTSRDKEIVDWLSHVGAGRAEHVMRRFQMGRSWAYSRLGLLVADGLLEQRTLLYRTPGLYIATSEGLRWCGLRRLGVYRVGPGGFEHATQVARIAGELHHVAPDAQVLSERDIRDHETATGDLLASARLGERSDGRPALHRPDLALARNDGQTVAIEVELSVKAPRRLAAICRAWARARHIDLICYVATPPARRALERVIGETRAADRIRVIAIDDDDALSQLGLAEGVRHG